MDLGATICRPADPRCEVCPLATWCTWHAAAAASSAGGTPRSAAAHRRGHRTPDRSFPSTRRWLRGRIIAALREAPDGAWIHLPGPMGEHAAAAVAAAIAGLAGEGMLEQRPDGAVRLPSA